MNVLLIEPISKSVLLERASGCLRCHTIVEDVVLSLHDDPHCHPGDAITRHDRADRLRDNPLDDGPPVVGSMAVRRQQDRGAQDRDRGTLNLRSDIR